MTPKDNENKFQINDGDYYEITSEHGERFLVKVEALEELNQYFPINMVCQDEPHLIAETSEEADELIDMWLKGRD